MRALLVLLLLAFPIVEASTKDYGVTSAEDATGWNTQRKMARADDGTLYHTFARRALDGASEVVVLRDGAELPSPRAARGDVSRPSLALDSQERLFLAWTERAEEDREVFAARFDGAGWVDVTQLSGGAGYAGFPSLAADANGGMHVAWYGFDGTNYQAFYRRFDGAAWLPAVQLSSGTLDANNPSITVDREGAVHVAWYKSDGRRYHIWYARQAPSGEWDLPRRLSAGEGEAYNAALAVDANGTLHAVWDELRADGYNVVHVQRNESGAWTAPRAIADGRTGGEYPALAAWRGTMLVAWARVDGSLMGTTLDGKPAPLLHGATGRHPSLRGPTWSPAGDTRTTLDILYAEPQGSAWRVRLVSLHPDCSPFEAPPACARDPLAAARWGEAPASRQAGMPVAAFVLLALVLAAAYRR